MTTQDQPGRQAYVLPQSIEYSRQGSPSEQEAVLGLIEQHRGGPSATASVISSPSMGRQAVHNDSVILGEAQAGIVDAAWREDLAPLLRLLFLAQEVHVSV